MSGRAPPLWALAFAALAAALAGASAYMHLARGVGLTEPQVFFPALGAVWFAVRAAQNFFLQR